MTLVIKISDPVTALRI